MCLLSEVKLSMKRILTVLTRREIHQQVIRAKEMLLQQTRREVSAALRWLSVAQELETQRFQLEEAMKVLSHKAFRVDRIIRFRHHMRGFELFGGQTRPFEPVLLC